MKKKAVSLLLAFVLALGLVPTAALAYSTPDFSDVPSNHWAYEAVMKMADAGVIKGTGAGQFSPDMKLSAEMFVVLVGRVVFPDVKADGADWSGPYITEAKAKGLLTGTNVTDANIKGDISRYDMAVILTKCVEIFKVSATKADSSKVADYGEVPAKYIDAVLMAYGSGLIRGDQSGSFNGQNSMTRQEAAMVMDRLLGLKGGSAQGTTTEPEKPTETQKPADPNDDWEYASARALVPEPYDPDEVELRQGKNLWIYRGFMALNAWGKRGQAYLRVGETLQLTVEEVPAGYNYTKEDVQWSSDDESIAQADENGLVTVVGEGMVWIDATVPVIYYGDIWTTTMDRITLYCEGK